MIKKVEDIVTDVLKKEPRARDNDEILCVCVWFKQVGHRIQYMSLRDFFHKMADGKYHKAESIMRCRRKLQELDEGLRGDKYKYRQQRKLEVRKSMLDWS